MKKLLTMLSVLATTSIIMPSTVACTVKANRCNPEPELDPTNEKTDTDKVKDAIEALSKIKNEEVEVLGPLQLYFTRLR